MDQKHVKKETLSSNLGNMDFKTTPRVGDQDSILGEDIRSRVSLLSGYLERCKVQVDELKKYFGRCKVLAKEAVRNPDRSKSKSKSDPSQKDETEEQISSKADELKRSTTAGKTQLKRHAEGQGFKDSSAKRSKYVSNVDSNVGSDSYAQQAIDPKQSVLAGKDTKAKDKHQPQPADTNSTLYANDRTNAAQSTDFGMSGTLSNNKTIQYPRDRFKNEDTLAILTSLSTLSKQIPEHEEKLRIYLDQMMMEHERSTGDGTKATGYQACYQALKVFVDSIFDFRLKLHEATMAL